MVHLGHHFILVHAGTDEARGGDVHIGSDVAGALYLGNLLGRLVVALLHHGADERHGAFLMGGGQSQPIHQFQLVLRTIGRQVMDGAPLLDGVVKIGHQLVRGTRLGDAHGGCLFVQSGLRAHPDDVVDGQLVAEDNLAVLVDVYHGIQPGKIQAEIIEERGILPVAEGIVLVVQSLFVIAQEQQQPLPDGFLQPGPALHVGFFCKHSSLISLGILNNHWRLRTGISRPVSADICARTR